MTIAAHRWWFALLLVAAVVAVWIGWVGFIASDDALYYAGAAPWLEHPPFPGDTHWSTRFPLTLAFAGVLAVAGKGFAAFAIVSLIFYALLIATSATFARQVAGARAAWMTALIVATLPVVVSHATTVSVDLLEASALLAGALLLGRADATRRGLWRGAAAGALFGVAVLCRETSLLPMVGVGALFLFGRPVPRAAVVAAGLGAAAVLGAEALFQAVMTGDPMRRYTIAFHHDEHIDRAANMEGNFLLHPAIDPLLVLLVNDDFGLLFWLAGGAFAATRGKTIGWSRPLVVLAAMAAASFVLVAVLYTKLVLNPRYFTVPALLAAVWLAGWAARHRWGAMSVAALVATNLGLLSLANAHPRWEMEALVAAARAHPREMIAADPNTVARADLPMRFLGAGRVGAHSIPGGLVIAPANAPPAGRVVARYPSPPTRAGALVRALGLESLVPARIAQRLFSPSTAMVLVRTPG